MPPEAGAEKVLSAEASPAPAGGAGQGGSRSPALLVKGFKCFRDEARVEIRPLTILAGANSSGKSAIMQPLLLLKQTLESPFDPGPLLLDGPYVAFSNLVQCAWTPTPGGDRAAGLSIGLEFPTRLSLNLSEMEVWGHCIGWTRANPLPIPVPARHARIRVESVDHVLRIAHVDVAVGEDECRFSPGAEGTSTEPWMPDYQQAEFREAEGRKNEEGQPLRKWRVKSERCGVALETVAPRAMGSPMTRGTWLDLQYDLWRAALGLIYLPSKRSFDRRAFSVTGVGERFPRPFQNFPGPFDPYVPSLILDWQGKEDPKLSQVREALAALGVTWTVKARRVTDAHIEVLVGRTLSAPPAGSGDLVNIADAGRGTGDALAVIVALLAAKQEQFVYIDKPESELHPRAIAGLAEIVAAAAKRRVRVILETHSSLLITSLLTLVAKGELPAEDVALHWFKRDPETGATSVESADVDERGCFGDWPEDFGKVEMEVTDDFLKASLVGFQK